MRVLVGVSGGVAAYKAAELVRELQRRGAAVRVAMTAGAEHFVTPLTFASLSGQHVLTSLWEPATPVHGEGSFQIEHIQIAQEIDAMVIAPATANVLAKLAHGLADDLLTTIALATPAPVLLAPAMNVQMWDHAATQANVASLAARGVQIVAPGKGPLACGMVGDGRLAEVGTIADAVMHAAARRDDMAGQVVLVTAGGTREAIDPVRFLGNRSSGRMGFALAAAARARGAEVLLVAGTISVPAPAGCEQVQVTTAAEMHAAVLELLPRATTVIMAAAVTDYYVAAPAPQKLKRSVADALTLVLERTPDILAEVVLRRKPGTLVVGFAAETEDVLAEGRRKLLGKGVDALVANDVSSARSGFEVDRNGGWLLTPGTEIELPLESKRAMAERILDHLLQLQKSTAPEVD